LSLTSKYGILAFISLFISAATVAQQKVSITLLDSRTSTPVSYAHLCFEDQKTGKQSYIFTDNAGKAEREIQIPSVLAISMMGYRTKIDTLTNSGVFTILLEPSLFDLDEVVVTAQMTPRKVDQSIYQVKVLNSKLISEKSASTLSGLLSNELNLRISQDGSLGSTMTLNGLGGEHVKILIDGVPVIGRMDGNIDLNQINLSNVDHVEIVEGPMSVQYGSNALAGAINIITKENTRNKFLASASTYYESVGIYNGNASIAVNQKGNSFSLDGGRNFFSGFSRPDTSRSQQWKPKEQLFANTFYSLNKNNLKFRTDAKIFRETILAKGEVRGKYDIWALDNYFITNRITTKSMLSGPLSDNSNFDVMVSWSGYSRIKNTYRKDMTTLEKTISSAESLQDTTAFSAILSRGNLSWQPKSGKIALQTGFDLNYESGKGKRILDKDQTMGDYAVFVSSQYNPSTKLNFQPGFRVAYNTRYHAPVVPSLNIKWSPVKDLSYRMSYVRGFRAPSLKELYLYFVDINHDVRGNPDLKAEYSHNINASVQYDKAYNSNYLGFELNGFDNIVDNKIDLVNDSANIYSYANINDFRSIGFNLKLKYRLHPRFNLSLGISRTGTYSSISSLPHTLDNYIFSTDYTAEFRYDLFSSGTNISAFYKYNGRYPYYYLNADNNIKIGSMNSYNSLDISLNKSFFKKNLMLSAGGKNLFNVTNVPKSGAGAQAHSGGDGNSPVGWGRTFFIGLNYKFATY
jgi:outer membrane receptor for ferrienterochelin and colicins